LFFINSPPEISLPAGKLSSSKIHQGENSTLPKIKRLCTNNRIYTKTMGNFNELQNFPIDFGGRWHVIPKGRVIGLINCALQNDYLNMCMDMCEEKSGWER